MTATEDMNCYEYGAAADSLSFEFHKGIDANRGPNPRIVLNSLSKPAPSKWDDAQKWIVGFSGKADHGNLKAIKPRNSNADERKHGFIANPKNMNTGEGANDCDLVAVSNPDGEPKKIDYNDSFWAVNKPLEDSCLIRSVCVRDMGTEMTPIGSQEPSRTATPIRATTPTMRSPISSRMSSPPRRNQAVQFVENDQVVQGTQYVENRQVVQAISDNGIPTMLPGRTSFCGTGWVNKDEEVSEASKILQKTNSERDRRASMLDMRAMAWDEAESAKYMARYKREEMKIQAWENHQKTRAEAEMRRIEAKAERMKSDAQERLANKIAEARRKADEKRANAEAKMSEQAVRTSERADYIRRTGHLPISFRHLKLPSFCW